MIETQTIFQFFETPDDHTVFQNIVAALEAMPAQRLSDGKRLGFLGHHYAFTNDDVANAAAGAIARGAILLPSVGDGLQAAETIVEKSTKTKIYPAQEAYAIVLQAWIAKYPNGYQDPAGSGATGTWQMDMNGFVDGPTYPTVAAAMTDAYPFSMWGSLNSSNTAADQANNYTIMPGNLVAQTLVNATCEDYDYILSTQAQPTWLTAITPAKPYPWVVGHDQYHQIEHDKTWVGNVPVKFVANA